MPDDTGFLTKPALATGMIICALFAGVPARWVAGDEVYGAVPLLRAELQTRRVGYVLAIGCDRRIPTQAGPIRADELAGQTLACPLAWSLWLRRHQHRARTSHYQRQEDTQPWT